MLRYRNISHARRVMISEYRSSSYIEYTAPRDQVGFASCSYVVHNPMKMEKSAEPITFGSLSLKATCTQARMPTMLAGINLHQRHERLGC